MNEADWPQEAMTPPQKPRVSRGALSPAGSEGGSSVPSKLPRPSSSVNMSRTSLPRPTSSGALSSRGASGDLANSSTAGCNQKDYISVAVRVRPIKYESYILSSTTASTLTNLTRVSQLHQRNVLERACLNTLVGPVVQASCTRYLNQFLSY